MICFHNVLVVGASYDARAILSSSSTQLSGGTEGWVGGCNKTDGADSGCQLVDTSQALGARKQGQAKRRPWLDARKQETMVCWTRTHRLARTPEVQAQGKPGRRSVQTACADCRTNGSEWPRPLFLKPATPRTETRRRDRLQGASAPLVGGQPPRVLSYRRQACPQPGREQTQASHSLACDRPS
jgi:hypothetical protein